MVLILSKMVLILSKMVCDYARRLVYIFQCLIKVHLRFPARLTMMMLFLIKMFLLPADLVTGALMRTNVYSIHTPHTLRLYELVSFFYFFECFFCTMFTTIYSICYYTLLFYI